MNRLLRLKIVLAVCVIVIACPQIENPAMAAENIGKVQQPLVGGQLVGAGMLEKLGLLTLNSSSGSCSASLLNNYWGITASHCVEVGPTITMLLSASAITLSTSWGSVQSQQAVQIASFRPLDVAILRLNRPFTASNRSDGFKQSALGVEPIKFPIFRMELGI
jgi:secreted trypsin-like serine protease